MKNDHIIDPLWHLPEGLSLKEAACLIAGYDPNEITSVGDNDMHERYPRYLPAIRSLKHAVTASTLASDIKWEQEYVAEHDQYYKTDIMSITETTASVEEIKRWLSARGFRASFFYPTTMADYLDPSHEHYSQKLAATVRVWEAITSDRTLMRGKSAKQAMMEWLRRNADKFGLTKEDGNPNEQGIEEVAKIANWDAKGGAPKTPANNSPTP